MWKELEKENKEFFETYAKKKREEKGGDERESSESSQRKRIRDIVSDSTRKGSSCDDDNK